MKTLHICNTFFEWELNALLPSSLNQAFDEHPVFAQLQFLPFLYASKSDYVFITKKPHDAFWQKLATLSKDYPQPFFSKDPTPHCDRVMSWAPSLLIKKWAEEHGITYEIAPWDVIKSIHSKIFAFSLCPFPGGAILHNEKELHNWLKEQKGDVVLKAALSSSGRGHLIFSTSSMDVQKVNSFVNKEWDKKLPVVAQPWMSRVLDFSTQWEISRDHQVEYLGATICENDVMGKYRASIVGELTSYFSSYPSALDEHIKFVRKILPKIIQLGYFGSLGFDAMIFKTADDCLHLQCIVEINARKTMGWAVLKIQQKHFPQKTLRMSYTNSASEGFLPIDMEQKKKKWQRHLCLEIL